MNNLNESTGATAEAEAEAECDKLLDLESATPEQRFVLMLHERIIRLEKDNERTMKFLFSPPPPPKLIPEVFVPLLDKLRENKNRFNDKIPSVREHNSGLALIPPAVLAVLPSAALDNACQFAGMTQSDIAYPHIFDYAIWMLNKCDVTSATPDLVTWVERLINKNIEKLS